MFVLHFLSAHWKQVPFVIKLLNCLTTLVLYIMAMMLSACSHMEFLWVFPTYVLNVFQSILALRGTADLLIN